MSRKKPAPPAAPKSPKKVIPPAPIPKKKSSEVLPAVLKPTKKRFRLKLVFIIASSVLVLGLGAATAYAFSYSPRYLPKTYVAGVDIGGMNQAQALSAVTAHENSFLNSQITLAYQAKSWKLTPSSIQSSFANQSLLNTLWQRQKGGDIRSQLRQLAKGLLVTQRYEPDFTLDSSIGQTTLQKTVFSQVETPYQETTINFTASPVAIIPGKAGTQVNQTALQKAVDQAFIDGESKAQLSLIPFEPKITPAMAASALAQAQGLLQNNVIVQLGSTNVTETLTPTMIAGWLTTTLTTDSQGNPTGLALSFQKDAIMSTLAKWSQQISQSPKNALLQHDANGVVSVATPDVPGITLDQDATYDTLVQFVQSVHPPKTVVATVSAVQATVRADNYLSLGLGDLIGTDTTNFSGSPKDRVVNIDQGQKLLNGILVAPGGTFSTIKNLGDIDSAHGFVPELVILNGTQLVDQDGGGLCQVSTTLFRATLNAGLSIVERQNHSFRVEYYEVGTGPGLDATIYDPQPDFQWKNDTAQNIYVESSVSGNNLTFDLYGTSDGRVVTIGKPKILSTTPPGPAQYVNTSSLPTGKTEELIGPVAGADVTVTYTVVRAGQTLENRTFVSDYIPEPAQFEVGTGPAN